MAFAPSSRGRLTTRDLGRFPDATLFHRLARAVCRAGCLPRKELFEAWEAGRRIRRLFRGGRIVDACAAHGMLAHVLLVLDDSSSGALVVDTRIAPSAAKIHEALVDCWPRLSGRVQFVAGRFEDVALTADDLVVSIHACGAASDLVIERAIAARARVAVVPCCHDAATCDPGDLGGWVDEALAIDVMRAVSLGAAGYRVWTQQIPEAITPMNRLLLGAPR